MILGYFIVRKQNNTRTKKMPFEHYNPTKIPTIDDIKEPLFLGE